MSRNILPIALVTAAAVATGGCSAEAGPDLGQFETLDSVSVISAKDNPAEVDLAVNIGPEADLVDVNLSKSIGKILTGSKFIITCYEQEGETYALVVKVSAAQKGQDDATGLAIAGGSLQEDITNGVYKDLLQTCTEVNSSFTQPAV